MRWSRAAVATAVILAATWLQMVIGLTVGFEAFNGKGFIGRIVIYPLLMLALPAWWWWRHRDTDQPMPWGRPALTVLTIVGTGGAAVRAPRPGVAPPRTLEHRAGHPAGALTCERCSGYSLVILRKGVVIRTVLPPKSTVAPPSSTPTTRPSP